MFDWWNGWLTFHPLAGKVFALAVIAVLGVVTVGAAVGTLYAVLYFVRMVRTSLEFTGRPLPEVREGKVTGLGSVSVADWVKREEAVVDKTAEGLRDLQRFADGLKEGIIVVAKELEKLDARLGNTEADVRALRGGK